MYRSLYVVRLLLSSVQNMENMDREYEKLQTLLLQRKIRNENGNLVYFQLHQHDECVKIPLTNTQPSRSLGYSVPTVSCTVNITNKVH